MNIHEAMFYLSMLGVCMAGLYIAVIVVVALLVVCTGGRK